MASFLFPLARRFADASPPSTADAAWTGRASIRLQPDFITFPDGTSHRLHAELIDLDNFADAHVNAEGTVIGTEHPKATIAALGLTTASAAAAGALIGGGVGAGSGAAIGVGAGAVYGSSATFSRSFPSAPASSSHSTSRSPSPLPLKLQSWHTRARFTRAAERPSTTEGLFASAQSYPEQPLPVLLVAPVALFQVLENPLKICVLAHAPPRRILLNHGKFSLPR